MNQNLIPDPSETIATSSGANEGLQLEGQSRFKILNQEQQGRCATFELLEEDHTLGNALRHIILKNPNVKFCGYACPHPNERKINFQIQVYKGDALEALEIGFQNLVALNEVVKEKILAAYEDFGHVEFVDSEEEEEALLQKLIATNVNKD